MIESTTIERIKASADIVDVVSEYVNLKRTGSSWSGFCPFHDNRKSPAFSVNPAKQYCKCFSCMDTTYDVIDFVAKIENISKGAAIRRLAERYHIAIDNKPPPEAKPTFTKVAPQDTFTYKRKNFTPEELQILGKNITAEVCEEQFSLYSVASFILPSKQGAESWEIGSTPECPIFVYDYGEWGRIYQPLSKTNRFSYFGEKPQDSVSGSRKVMKLYNNAIKGIVPEPEDKLGEIIIASGGSDALNICCNSPFQVMFFNSESADISTFMYNALKRITHKVYLCYDIDATGIRQAQKYALQYLDFHIIHLPEDLRNFRDRKGAPCKDAKDFFCHYRSKKYQKNDYLFRQLVRTSLPMQFWNETDKEDKDGNIVSTKYEINNEQMYQFLSACGLYTYDNPQNREGFDYIQMDNNVVTDIKEKAVQAHANALLVNFLKNNLEYYDITLINTIHKSNQAKLSSLEKLKRIQLDYKTFGKEHDYLFFKNTAVRINAEGLEVKQFSEKDKFIHNYEVIDHNFRKENELFRVDYSKEYERLQQQVSELDPASDAFKEATQQLNALPDARKYDLTIDSNHSFLKFVYNTGKFYWRKERDGELLTTTEKREEDLFFISKVCALGYLMYRYKEMAKSYMVYAIETELDSAAEHKGGTGKSLYFEALRFVRQFERTGGKELDTKDKNFFSKVELGKTNIFYLDDLERNVKLSFFLPSITGSMDVEAKYKNAITIPFADSPKLCVSSNHAPGEFDGPLKRRLWFTGFCDYYHGADAGAGLKEFSPYTEFGKNLLIDYTEKEMNQFYNFMAQCLHTFLKFRERINPPIDMIEQRILRRTLSEEFIQWAEDFFQPDKLNTNIDKEEIMESYKTTLPPAFANNAKHSKLKAKIQTYCRYKKWVFNPAQMLTTESEKSRNEIRKTEMGVNYYYYYIEAPDEIKPAKLPF